MLNNRFYNLQTNPCKHPVIILKDVRAEELLDVLDFMYRGEASVKKENLAAFLRLAENLKVKGLADYQDEEVGCTIVGKGGSMTLNNSLIFFFRKTKMIWSTKKRTERFL